MADADAGIPVRDTRARDQAESPRIADDRWVPVMVPTDRPRRPGVATRCSAMTTVPRSEFGAAPDELILAGFAAMLFRYTAQTPISVDYSDERRRYVVTGDSSLTDLTERVERTPAPAGGVELRLVVDPDRVGLHYDDALFDPETIARMLGHLRMLVDDATRTPERTVGELRLLTDSETHRMLIEWNRTESDLPYDTCLHQAFEERVARAPDAVAIVHLGRRWTYEEVNGRANRLAHHLRSFGVGPDVGVGLCLDRSPDLLISMLGVMKAGGAYVPLDPRYPTERLAIMARGNPLTVMISRTDLAANLPENGPQLILLDRQAELLAAQPSHNPRVPVDPEDLCYIMHTSGSTGVPKPIALRHRGVMNNLADLNARCEAGPGDAILALSSPSFDMSVYEFLGTATAGATLVIPDQARNVDLGHWVDLMRTERVTIWNSAPALLALLLGHLEQQGTDIPLPAWRVVMLGGDWAPVAMPYRVWAIAPAVRVIVCGGNTEASIQSTSYEVDAVDPSWKSIPYGRPLANQRVYILDEALRPVPPRVPGELCLAGMGLARGYLNMPDETAARFVTWSHGPIIGERIYRTGDLARYAPDGEIELLGRMDFQVKINGMRVELGEVETVLRGHANVREAVVVARDGRLVAYVVPKGQPPTTDSLREVAARRLPDHMVPGVFVLMDELPYTPNGKLDRNGFPEPQAVAAPFRAPRSAAERILVDIYADVLGVDQVGLDDDFIELGGDSIRAIQVASRARTRGIEIAASQVLQHGTIAAMEPTLAAAVPEIDIAENDEPLVELSEDERAELARRYPGWTDVWPLTSMQSGILFESLLDEGGSGAYQVQTVYHLSGEVDADRMHAVGRALLARHPSLTAAFVWDVVDRPIQVTVDGLEPAWQVIDLSDLSADAQAEAYERFLAEDRAEPFELDTPPLLRLALVRLGVGRANLVLTIHHLVIDGWSQQALADDIMRLYAGMALEPAASFRAFLAWLARQDTAARADAWRTELHGIPGPTTLVPANAARTKTPDLDEVEVPLTPNELTPAAGLGVTTGTVIAGAWATMLSALTGRGDVVFGLTVAGRPGDLAGVDTMVGTLINTIPVRAQVTLNTTIDELLIGLQRRQELMREHQHHGLSEIHQSLGVTALFDTMLAVQAYPTARGRGIEVEVTRTESLARASYPMTLIAETQRLVLQYDRNVFDRSTVEDIATRLRSVARQLARGGEQRLGTLTDIPAVRGATTAGAAGAAGGASRLPRTPREEALCELFAEVLGVERVGIDDNIFTLGCNSLTATRIIGRMRQKLGLEASIAAIFQHPTIAELSELVVPAKVRPNLRKITSP